jgi:TonB-linked SusC/RagA family outer membrane protein
MKNYSVKYQLFTRIIPVIVLMMISLKLSAQPIEVTGKIVDENNNPLIGVSVLEKGTTNGTISDLDGNFSIEVPPQSTLVISYVGYTTKEVPVENRTEMSVQLTPSAEDIEELVVIGYTTKRKSDLTGAVSVVDMDEMGKISYANVMQALTGQVSGVTITQDGQPGSGRTQVRVRGLTTYTNNDPLVVIDGVPTEESLDNLNPNDIESIQVLKDAASASIYGSRSAAGVIVITTKKGKAGKLSIDAGLLNGVQTLGNKIDLLDATQWGEVYWEAAANDGISPNHPLYGNGPEPVIPTVPYLIPNGKQIYQFTPEGTNWYDEVYRNALQQQYYLNLSNGSERGNFFLGMSYYDQDGLIKETFYDRYTGRFNSEFNVTDWLKVGENLSLSFSNQVQIGTQQGQDGIPTDVIRQHPMLPVYDVFGGYAGKISGLPDVRNMVSVLDKNKNNTTESWRVFGNVFAQADLYDAIFGHTATHDLIAKTNFGLEYSNFYDRRFEASYSEGDYDIQDNALTMNFGKGTTLTWTNTLEYNLNTTDHSLKLMGGMETVTYQGDFLSGRRNSFEIETPDFTYLSAGNSSSQVNAGSGSEWALLSYFGRTDYVYANKYLASATLRYDQTSRFNAAGLFPALSLGWKLSEEAFINNALENSGLDQVFSGIKVRAGYGEQGNQSVVENAIVSFLGPDVNHADYDIAGTNTEVQSGYVVLQRGNPNLLWETTSQLNVGTDLVLFNRMLEVNFDYFIKNTRDILIRSPQLTAVGEGAEPFINAAQVDNNGFELNIAHNYYNPDRNLRLYTQFTVNRFANEVVSLGDSIANLGYEGEFYLPTDGASRIATGYPIGSFYGYVVDGIFTSPQEADEHVIQRGKDVGRLRYENVNGDTIINDQDRTYLGSPHPIISFGLNFNADFKGFNLSLALYSSLGQKVYNETKWYTDFAQVGDFNRSTRILDAWSPSNTTSTIPAPTLNNANNENRPSSYFVEDASFLKLRKVRVGYSFPGIEKFGLSIYGEIQNVLTITNYSGVDPEVPHAGDVNIPGIDRGVYPLPRTFMVGVNIKL